MPTLQSEIPTDETALRQPVERVLQQAIDHHRAGSLLEAERGYRAILSQWPDHADANHNLGVLTVATGHAAAALPYFQAAIRANPGQGQFWLSCIDALIQIGQAEAARQMLDIGVRSGLRGDVVQTLRDRLERIASEAPSAGSVAAPIAALDAESSDGPEQTPAGGKGARRRRTAQSAKNRQKKASVNSYVPEPAETAWLLSLFEQGRDQEMESLARSFTERYPKSGYGWNMLGALRQRKSNFSDAATCYLRALEADPDCVEACFNLGRMLQEHGDLTKAEGCYRRALELYPGFLEAHYGLGEVFDLQGRFAESEACYRRVIEIQPDLAKAHNNLAVALTRQERSGESEASSRQALALTPRFAEAFCNLGAALQDQGRLAEAADSYRERSRSGPIFRSPITACSSVSATATGSSPRLSLLSIFASPNASRPRCVPHGRATRTPASPTVVCKSASSPATFASTLWPTSSSLCFPTWRATTGCRSTSTPITPPKTPSPIGCAVTFPTGTGSSPSPTTLWPRRSAPTASISSSI
jgi:protein O-GlcNAc transferase